MAAKANAKQRLEALGHGIFYLAMRLFGQRGGYILLWPVIFSYVLCSRKIKQLSGPYLRRRFPEHGFVRRWRDTLKNLIAFGRVLVDRGWMGVSGEDLQGEIVGYEKLVALAEQGKGVVLLTAHVGNWQTAFAHLGDLPVPVHALMRYDQQAVAKHYFDLRGKERSFAIINSDGPLGGVVEATAALQRGEMVTIMGDRLEGGSFVTVDFLGDAVRLPATAYVLAACVGAPVVVVLAAKTGRKNFQLRVWGVWHPRYENRGERAEMLRESGLKFVKILDNYLRKYPYQWYNFYDFWKQ
ncbi:MAG: lysophospholipid acyltransferase family protein [Desulfobulbaceae bacterium]|nr:lysophospholipid acyltransferase family protein [Desulfobulbaceae bacterium]HIJ78968.1 lysophospholipid acyltransferase family protein [Deltaproteobacteria bacterium]